MGALQRGRVAWVAAALVLVAPGAGASGNLSVTPSPVPAHGTATVTATFDVPVTEAELLVCRASATGNVGSCYQPSAMTDAGGGNWTGEAPPTGTLKGSAMVGLNATGGTAEGDPVHIPGQGARYVFVAVQETPTDTLPTSGAAWGAAALAAAALARP